MLHAINYVSGRYCCTADSMSVTGGVRDWLNFECFISLEFRGRFICGSPYMWKYITTSWNPLNSCCCYYCCCCWSPSRSTTTLHYQELSGRAAACERRWLCSPKSEAQSLLQWGQRGPVFGLAVEAWRAARRFMEVLIQSFVKLFKPASHTVLQTYRSLAEASRSNKRTA